MESGYSIQVRWHLHRYGCHLRATSQQRVAGLRRGPLLWLCRLASAFSGHYQQWNHGFQAWSTILGALAGAVYSQCCLIINKFSIDLQLATVHSLATFFLSLTVKTHVHSVTHGHIRKQRQACHTEFEMARLDESAFNVFQGHPYIGVSRNSERPVVVMYNNADVKSET